MSAPEPARTVALPSDQLGLVRRTIAQGATDDELALYLYDCQRHGVHPLDKLLHFTKRGGKYVPITSIDLMRTRAAETGECFGISDADFSGVPEQEGFAATVTVRRLVQGQIARFTATARWAEYYPGDGPQGTMWRRMPHTMLGKCAEALALRKGFPKQLAGLYAREELDQTSRGDAAQVKAFALASGTAPDTETPDERVERVPGSDDGAWLGGWAGDPDAAEEPSSEPEPADDPVAPERETCISAGKLKLLHVLIGKVATATGESRDVVTEHVRQKVEKELHVAKLAWIPWRGDGFKRLVAWLEAQAVVRS